MNSQNDKSPATGTRILVVDGTGRGHAICDLFTRTHPDVTVFYGPGCDVIDQERIVPVPSISLDEPRTALDFLKDNPVEFVFVSNIDALSRGYVDVLRAHGHRAIGPTRAAAELESSKERGKRFCSDHGIPTAPYQFFTDPEAAKAYIRSRPYACVVKTDGLCKNGDGAIVCKTASEAEAAVDGFARESGDAFQVVVEKRLEGQEISIFALLDGDSYLLFPTALDFKRALENDAGKNCDGMGSIAPHPADGPTLREEIRETLLDPLVRGLRQEGLDFSGFIYVGAMMTDTGLHVIELNARFGDSEAEAVLPGVHSDFTQLCRAILAKELRDQGLVTDGFVRCSVALTQGRVESTDPESLPGWPFGAFITGQPITGLDTVDPSEATLFYANLQKDAEGRPVTSGGRVLHVVGKGLSLAGAVDAAYGQLGRIAFPGMRYRTDIGARLLATGGAGHRAASEAPGTIFEDRESDVRSYSRSFPTLFARAKGDWLIARDGTRYLDFFAGAGALNYGHNPEALKHRLLTYLESDGLTHGLDFATSAKADFLHTFQQYVLAPRGLDYKVQFCSPSGTNAVEAALKLARLVTGRGNILSFSGGFHGVSMGSLAATGAAYYKQGLYSSLPRTTQVPYPDSPLGRFNSLDYLRRLVEDPSSGTEKPAAILLETVQAEGGIYVAPVEFLRGLRAFCDKHGILLIVDDIQAGCGRTGTFFSFERAGIQPDLVTLSKSISGYGLPMAVLLIKPELDIWQPGQHNGTFRGNQLAFIAGAEAIRQHWMDGTFAASTREKGGLVAEYLERHVTRVFGAPVRGMGLIWGIDLSGISGITAGQVSKHCFARGLVIETCGRQDDVLKLLPPLTISRENLELGLGVIVEALHEATCGAFNPNLKVAG
ncbi:diaminobutyrate--2-oxoglutarate transaminase [Archangium violaceum]|uniref:diaminobutyrate--2-oxoglutarate transaminase n=1 Tax=Archangium violaceum TaxID=83451 RepID=UPI00194DE3CA|nr:diaminobutyrate--2-oxoglutarate transaminase [Archangium violaceum]QRN95683.1 diaminobutyrate--2-oxoglutarate transaminase [Archangium violaceum]